MLIETWMLTFFILVFWRQVNIVEIFSPQFTVVLSFSFQGGAIHYTIRGPKRWYIES